MRNVVLIVVSVLVGFILGYIHREDPIVETVYKEHYVHDTVLVEVVKPVRVNVPVSVPVYESCDTLRAEYERMYLSHNSRLYYSDTISIDTIGAVYIEQQVYQNRIDSLRYWYNVSRSVVVNTPNFENRGTFYAGFLAGRYNISPMLFYGNKRLYFGLGYNVIEPSLMFSFGLTVKSIK